jgi:putative flippase GtrA
VPIRYLEKKFPRTAALLVRFRHPVAYLVVGGCAGLIHLSVAFSAMHFAGVEPAYASLIGFVAANPFSYFGHKLVTFMVPGRDLFEATRFVVGALVGLALASALPYILINWLAAPRIAALTVTVVAIPLVNYLAMRFWIFTKRTGL